MQSSTWVDHVAQFIETEEFRDWRREQVIMGLSTQILAFEKHDREATMATLCEMLDQRAAGLPGVSLLDEMLRADADYWADMATPREVETYLAAIMRHFGDKGFGVKARKRMLVMLWDGLSDADRQAFLSAVDPQGKFRGRK